MAKLRKPLVPDGPVKTFYDRWHAMHLAAGQPSVRQLQRATRSARRPKGINPTTIHDSFVRPRLAQWEVVQEIGRQLGGDLAELFRLWRQAHEVQLRYYEPPEPGDETDALNLAAIVPRELPPDVFAFTGRENHLAQLDALLAAKEGTAATIVAIVGMAGVGKTSLATHWGHRMRGSFPDGQIYLNLRGHAVEKPMRPLEALTSILRSLGVPADQIPGDVPGAAARYRSLLAERRMLVHLDDAASAEQVRPLLVASPACIVLVTSRDRLSDLAARDGAHRIPLDVLSADEAHLLLSRVLGPQRVAGEPDAVDDLARACSYLPLAMRVAAADLANRAMPAIADYVTVFLAGDGLSASELDGDEQTGVWRAFELSYQSLSAEARSLLRLNGLAAGPHLTAESAAALAGTSTRQSARCLEQLAAAHLLHQRAPGKYGCHDLVRQYAAQRAWHEESHAQRRDALERFYDWYLFAADAAAKLLYPHRLRLPVPQKKPLIVTTFTDEASAMAWLDQERPNLLGVIRQAAEHGPRPTVWLLSDTLRGYFWLGLHTVDWAETAQLSLAAAEAEGDLRAQVAALLSIADTDDRLNRPLTERATEVIDQLAVSLDG